MKEKNLIFHIRTPVIITFIETEDFDFHSTITEDSDGLCVRRVCDLMKLLPIGPKV